MQDIKVGEWDMPLLSIEQAMREDHPASRVFLSEGGVVERPGLAAVCDPAQRGLVDALLKPKRIAVDDCNLLFFSHARLFASRLVISSESKLYSDQRLSDEVLDQWLAGKGDIKTVEHKLFKTDGGYGSEALAGNSETLEGPHVLLTSSEPVNYGAWLIRVFPKIYNLRKAGAFEAGQFLCYIDRPWQEKLLEWAGVPLSRVRRQSITGLYNVDRLVVPTWPSRNKYLDQGILSFIEETRGKVHLKQGEQAGKPIYVSRMSWNKVLDARIAGKPGIPRMRPFDQEQELATRLEALGLEVLTPEEYPFEETLSKFVNAPLVIGPQGAGLFNAIFCKPGTPVIEIAHLPYFAQGHANMFLSCGLKYMVFVGEDPELGMDGAHPVHRLLKVDIEAAVSFVAKQLSQL